MRGVVLGTDLMFDNTGRLVPIEINTNVGYDHGNRVEDGEDWLDLTSFVAFIKKHKIKTVKLDSRSTTLLASRLNFRQKLEEALGKYKADIGLTDEDIVEDDDTTFYLRIAFSEEALVDAYCRDKASFFDITSLSEKISQEYLYKEGGELKGNMRDDYSNGPYKPNYMVKFRYPVYSAEYPKFYVLKNAEEVKRVAESLDEGYIMMPCYLNEEKKLNGRYPLLRQWSIITVEDEKLKAIDLGYYTKYSGLESPIEVDSKTGEVIKGAEQFSTKSWNRNSLQVYLEASDEVLIADGTWKAAKDLKVGDEVTAVDVPHGEEVDITKHVGSYNVPEEEFLKDSEFATNKIRVVKEVEGWSDMTHLRFNEDEEEWWDTGDSSYPTLYDKAGNIGFRKIKDLSVGDTIYLVKLDSVGKKLEYVKRTIKSVRTERQYIEGYTLSLDGSHLFVAKSQESTSGYISLEHNAADCDDLCSSYRGGSLGVAKATCDAVYTTCDNYGCPRSNCICEFDVKASGNIYCACCSI